MLGAISFSHSLNDMIQSLILAIYPLLKNEFSLSFTQIGSDHLDLSDHGIHSAAVGRALHRPPPQTLFSVHGHGLHTDRADSPGVGAELRRAASLPPPWSALVHRSFIRNLRGLREWPPAGDTAWRSRSSRLAGIPAAQWGHCWRPGSSFLEAGAASPGFLWPRCSPCWCCGGLADGTRAANRKRPARPSRTCPCRDGAPGRTVAGALLVLLVLMFSKFFYLASLSSYLHFYLMQQIPAFGAIRAGSPVRLLVCSGRRDHLGRTRRRSNWPQTRDLGIDSGSRAIHARFCPMQIWNGSEC